MFLSKYLVKPKISAALLNMTQVRSVAIVKEGSTKLKHKIKETSDEEIYFSEHERSVIKRLINKMEDKLNEAKHEGHHNTHGHSHNNEEDNHIRSKKHHDKLKHIFEKHGVKDDKKLMEDLSEWKHSK